MTVTAHKRTIFDALLVEPIELIINQPHQALISSASVFLVAAEAHHLIDQPYNVLMAIGAEWAYLRGMSSGQGAATRWAAALNWSAVLLVVAYGCLWGFRKFNVIPEQPDPWLGVALTLVHILCIGAVTLCSAMVHRSMLRATKAQETAADTREQERRRETEDRRSAFEREQSAADATAARERDATRLAFEQEQERTNAKIQHGIAMANAKARMASVPLAKGNTARCAKCHKDVAWSTPSEAGTIRRWGCDVCRAKKESEA